MLKTKGRISFPSRLCPRIEMFDVLARIALLEFCKGEAFVNLLAKGLQVHGRHTSDKELGQGDQSENIGLEHDVDFVLVNLADVLLSVHQACLYRKVGSL